MIETLRVKGFRILRDFEWNVQAGVNILVGANSAGKSTVLEAIELVTRGNLNGVRAANALAPDWFNVEVVAEFFIKLQSGQTPEIPEILITAVFADAPSAATICGCNGPKGAEDDAPGLFIRFYVPQELTTEFLSEAAAIARTAAKKTLPVEYYECEWKSFKGERLVRRPACVVSTRIDTRPEPYSRAVDSYARNLVESELTDQQLREVARKIREAHAKIDDEILSTVPVKETGNGKSLGLQLDKSPRSDWKNAIVLEQEGLPFSTLGSADQILTKCGIAIQKSAVESIILMEEPECHLSHTSLRELLALIGESLGEEQQAFVTTHSPYVLNRLGLDKMSVMAAGSSPASISKLSPETTRYFKKLSGYDTLRIVLARKIVMVEGPTDEMVFDWAFRKERGCLPEDKGIDVIEYGIRYKRAFELAATIGKDSVIALRDNDHKGEALWLDTVEQFESSGYKLLVGHDGEGHTIEPQIVKANLNNLEVLAAAVGSKAVGEADLTEYLLNHKVEWSLNLLEADRSATDQLQAPRYILEAIELIDPLTFGG